MGRSRVAFALLLGAFVALYAAVAAPVPPASQRDPTSPAAFFPTVVGTEWNYRVNYSYAPGGRADRAFDEVKVVTDVTAQDGERFVRVREVRGDSPYPVTEWSVSETGLRRRGVTRNGSGAWITALSKSVVRGETWTQEIMSDRSRSVKRVVGWEEINVPAGAYRAVRVDLVMTVHERGVTGPIRETITGTWWYAPGVGCVKQTVVGQHQRFEIVRELVSFKPGNGVVPPAKAPLRDD